MMRQTLLNVFFLVSMIALFIWGASRQSMLVNTNMHSTDQSAYMDYAKNMARTHFQFVGGRNRMPIYPGFMSLFYRQGMSDEDFLKIVKGQLPAMQAYTSGKLKIEGDLMKSQLFEKLFKF